MELRLLKSFRMVARTLNFTEAAGILGYAQSSLTTHIKALEEELGLRLFDRLGRGIRLTESGRRLLAYAERMLNLEQEARAGLGKEGQDGGVISFSSVESLCTYRLPALLSRFGSQWPKTRLLFKPSSTFDLLRQVREGSLDVAFILQELAPPGELKIEPLIKEVVAVLAGPGHYLARRRKVHPLDLADEPILFTELGCDYRNQFERILIKAGVYPRTALEFSSIEPIKKCVAAGMGVAVLPEMAVAAELERGELVKLPWQGRSIKVATQMVWHSGRWLSPSLEGFLQLARECLQAD
ncbi:MAG: LysR family transcriptional regulator [Desulfarculaceae bacterium]|jgi:DNA-binding transcriptional LysR family regulator